jgi:vacuolar-type H+-ATPase subunit H
MTEKDLLRLKQQVDDARQTSAELRGHLAAQMKQLKDEWKCETVEEAEKLLDDMDAQIDDYDKKITQGLKELEEKYNA